MGNEWIPVAEKLPESGKYILLSFENFSLPMIGRYEGNETDGGSFYVGDETETRTKQDLFVNAWMPLPDPYRGEHPKQTNADRIRSMTDEELAKELSSIKKDGLYREDEYPVCWEVWEEWLLAESEEKHGE